jgi:uncharacterized small protein (DUF1192 family)
MDPNSAAESYLAEIRIQRDKLLDEKNHLGEQLLASQQRNLKLGNEVDQLQMQSTDLRSEISRLKAELVAVKTERDAYKTTALNPQEQSTSPPAVSSNGSRHVSELHNEHTPAPLSTKKEADSDLRSFSDTSKGLEAAEVSQNYVFERLYKNQITRSRSNDPPHHPVFKSLQQSAPST